MAAHEQPSIRRSINNGMELRILPLGASITAGVDSSDGNGYRLDLQQKLEGDGNNVTFVGTTFHGQMKDNACEAYPGYTIESIHNATLASGALDFMPNVILINAGTNDCNKKGKDPAGAPMRYATLLSHIKAKCPDALVVDSSLIPNLDSTVNDCIITLNGGLRRVSREARANGQKTTFVEMYDVVPTDDINTSDETHPNDAGYELMAQAWYEAIRNASSKIDAPVQGARKPLDSPGPTGGVTGLSAPAAFAVGFACVMIGVFAV